MKVEAEGALLMSSTALAVLAKMAWRVATSVELRSERSMPLLIANDWYAMAVSFCMGRGEEALSR